MALDGLEKTIKSLFSKRAKVHIIRYADDFVIIAESREILLEKIKPVIKEFLALRGLELSEEKTLITHINKGFTFLGKTIRKYGSKYVCKPSNDAVKSLRDKVRIIIKKYACAKTEVLIDKLNSIMRGWGNYHRFTCSSEIYCKLDYQIMGSLIRWARRRHKKSGYRKIYKKYFTKGSNRGIFSCIAKVGKTKRLYELIRMSSIKIKRHVKIRGEATPFDPAYDDYFEQRNIKGTSRFIYG